MPFKPDGYYKCYSKGKLLGTYNILNCKYYGECVYISNRGVKYICEIYGSNFSRIDCYSISGIKYYSAVNINNVISVKEKYIKTIPTDFSFHAFMDTKLYSSKCLEKFTKERVLNIFHYGDGKISYRDKNGKVVKYYKNEYKKNSYKNKTLFFY